MTKQHGEVVGFTFQEIPLEEARTVVLAGDGNYSELKQALLEKLPQLAPDKAFAFGLPNGREIPEDQRRGICMAVNATLKRAKLDWHITYSGTKKMFVCVPRTIREKSGKHLPSDHSTYSADDQRVFALRAQGLSANKIAQQVSTPIERVRYLVYQCAPGKRHGPPAQSSATPASVKSATDLVAMAKKMFHYTGDFTNGDAKVIRKAISVVGVMDLGIHPKEIASLVGVTPDAIYFNAHYSKSSKAQPEIQALRKAIKQEA